MGTVPAILTVLGLALGLTAVMKAGLRLLEQSATIKRGSDPSLCLDDELE